MFKLKKDFSIYLKETNTNLYLSLGELFNLFKAHNKELYLVGGCIRDLLLNKTPKDFDLCTSATPDEIKHIIKTTKLWKIYDSGIQHGTVTLVDSFFKQSFEVTTFRVDDNYSDNRHPDKVTFTSSLEEDLKRRDFTINSFAYNLLQDELFALDETFLADLEFGIIRTVGDPLKRFNEDALRMLRAIRFAAQLNFTIQRDTYEAIIKSASKISKISKERIRDELTKILLSNKPDLLKLFVLTGLEQPSFGFTPLLDIMQCDHENPWHYADVFHHTLDVVNAVPAEFNLRWAALLHDIGKPSVKTLKEGTKNYHNYIGHPEVSAEIALRLMEVLKFSNEQKNTIYKFVKYHDTHLAEVKNSTFKNIVNAIGKENFSDFIKLRVADSFAHRLLMDTKFAVDFPDIVKERFCKIIKEDKALKVTDLNINGYDLMHLGFEGKQIGDCLNYLLDQVLEEIIENNKEKLLEKAKTYKDSIV